MINYGTFNHNGQTINSSNSSTLTNHGTLNLNYNSWAGLAIVNENGGVVNKTTAGNISIPTSFTNNAGGTVNISDIGGIVHTGNLTNSGDYNVSGSVSLNGGSHTFHGGNNFGGTGFLHINVNSTIDAQSGFLPAFDTIYHNSATLTGTVGTKMTFPTSTRFIST